MLLISLKIVRISNKSRVLIIFLKKNQLIMNFKFKFENLKKKSKVLSKVKKR